MGKIELKEKIIDIICDFGDGKTEFETKDINELLNYINYLESEVNKLSKAVVIKSVCDNCLKQLDSDDYFVGYCRECTQDIKAN